MRSAYDAAVDTTERELSDDFKDYCRFCGNYSPDSERSSGRICKCCDEEIINRTCPRCKQFFQTTQGKLWIYEYQSHVPSLRYYKKKKVNA